MNQKTTLFGNTVYGDAILQNGERNAVPDRNNYSFGKNVTLGLQKQSTMSQKSLGGYDTNKLFASKPRSELDSNNPRKDSYSSNKAKMTPKKSKDLKLTKEKSSSGPNQSTNPGQTRNSKISNNKISWKPETTMVTPRSINTTKNQTQTQKFQITDNSATLKNKDQIIEMRNKYANSQQASYNNISRFDKTIISTDSGNIEKPEDSDSKQGIKNSVFNFFRIFQCRSEDRAHLESANVHINVDKPPMAQTIMSAKKNDFNSKGNNYPRNGKMNTQQISSMNFKKNETILDESQKNIEPQHKSPPPHSFLKRNTQRTAVNINLNNQKFENFDPISSPKANNKFTEITNINMINPLSNQPKTLFRVKKGPSMQIEFKNKQEKKEIQQETIANGETSDEESESQYTACNNLKEIGSFHHQRPTKSNPYMRTQNYSKDSRTSNMTSNNASKIMEMSHRSKHKLQQLDKVHSNKNDELNNDTPVSMSSDEMNDETPKTTQNKEMEDSLDQYPDEKIQFISNINTPLMSREEKSIRLNRLPPSSLGQQTVKQNDSHELQQEYERLEKELQRLREVSQTATSPRKKSIINASKSKVSNMTQDKIYQKKQQFEIKKTAKQSIVTEMNQYQYPNMHEESKQDKHLDQILNNVPTYFDEKKKISRQKYMQPSLEMDMRSFNSRLDSRIHTGSKMVMDEGELYMQEHHNKSAARSRESKHYKHKSKKNIKQKIESKRTTLPFKKSFLSENDTNNNSKSNQDNYSASGSSANSIGDEEKTVQNQGKGYSHYQMNKNRYKNHKTVDKRKSTSGGSYMLKTMVPTMNPTLNPTLNPTSQVSLMTQQQSMKMPNPVHDQYNIKVIHDYQQQVTHMQNQILQMQNRQLIQNQNSSLMNNSILNTSNFNGSTFMNQGNMMYPNHQMMLTQQIQTTGRNPDQSHNYQDTISSLKVQLEAQQNLIKQMQEQSMLDIDNTKTAEQIETFEDIYQPLGDLRTIDSKARSKSDNNREIVLKKVEDFEKKVYEDEYYGLEQKSSQDSPKNSKPSEEADIGPETVRNPREPAREQIQTIEGHKKVQSININNYKNAIIAQKQGSSGKVPGSPRKQPNELSIKNVLAAQKQSAGFPSMLDIGIQGVNAYEVTLSKRNFQTKIELKKKIDSNVSENMISYKEIEVDSTEEPNGKNAEETKEEQLLIIGFEDKPKGINPLISKDKLGLKRLSQRVDNNLIQKGDFWSPRIITQKLEQMPKFNLNKAEVTNEQQKTSRSSNKYLSAFNADLGENQTVADPNDEYINNKRSSKEIHIEVNNSPNSKNNRIEEAPGVTWPSSNIVHKKDKGSLLIADDMPNLQDVFMKKKKVLSVSNRRQTAAMSKNPIEQFQDENIKNHLDIPMANSVTNNSLIIGETENATLAKRSKTKAELAQLRKQMMQKKFKLGGNSSAADLRSEVSMANPLTNDREEAKESIGSPHGIKTKPNFTPKSKALKSGKSNIASSHTMKQLILPSTADKVLERLASGQKGPVDAKAMKRLTAKNFEKLPEILKKKEEAKRVQELQAKKERAEKNKKELDARLRNNLKTKAQKDKEKKTQQKGVIKETSTTTTQETVIISNKTDIQVFKNTTSTNTRESLI